MINFLAILELCPFYIEYKKVKLTAIDFRGRTNIKYFMQTQVLRFCKDTSKVCFLPLLRIITKSTRKIPKKKILILWIELQTNEVEKISDLTPKHRAVKNS